MTLYFMMMDPQFFCFVFEVYLLYYYTKGLLKQHNTIFVIKTLECHMFEVYRSSFFLGKIC
jgi:hypothetical protein